MSQRKKELSIEIVTFLQSNFESEDTRNFLFSICINVIQQKFSVLSMIRFILLKHLTKKPGLKTREIYELLQRIRDYIFNVPMLSSINKFTEIIFKRVDHYLKIHEIKRTMSDMSNDLTDTDLEQLQGRLEYDFNNWKQNIDPDQRELKKQNNNEGRKQDICECDTDPCSCKKVYGKDFKTMTNVGGRNDYVAGQHGVSEKQMTKLQEKDKFMADKKNETLDGHLAEIRDMCNALGIESKEVEKLWKTVYDKKTKENSSIPKENLYHRAYAIKIVYPKISFQSIFNLLLIKKKHRKREIKFYDFDDFIPDKNIVDFYGPFFQKLVESDIIKNSKLEEYKRNNEQISTIQYNFDDVFKMIDTLANPNIIKDALIERIKNLEVNRKKSYVRTEIYKVLKMDPNIIAKYTQPQLGSMIHIIEK